MLKQIIFLGLILIALINCNDIIQEKEQIVLSENIKDQDYKVIVQNIINAVKENSSELHHGAYKRLAYLSDTYGPRMWGSQQLEMFIAELTSMAQSVKIDTRLEPVTNFTKWVRGNEFLTLYSPRPYPQNISLIGLGLSISGNVTAEAFVVTSFDDLEANKDKVAGKIVVYAVEWEGYETTVNYRTSGASRAAKYGAVAILIRSVTPFSLESPHTGYMNYNLKYKRIPAAAISVEDAYMFKRMQNRGQKIVLHLYLENHRVYNSTSNNFIAEIKGSTNPEQIILFGGHIDSWDTGSQTGANDDGGGIISCFEALRVLKYLGLQPKRTLRVIGWSGEEYGQAQSGGFQYLYRHFNDMKNHILAFENDEGSNKPFGWGFSGSLRAKKIIKDIAETYFQTLNCSFVDTAPFSGVMADTGPLFALGVPVMRNLVKDFSDKKEYYFTFHHSAGDTMSIINPDSLDDNVVATAAMMYIIADIDKPLPKYEEGEEE